MLVRKPLIMLLLLSLTAEIWVGCEQVKRSPRTESSSPTIKEKEPESKKEKNSAPETEKTKEYNQKVRFYIKPVVAPIEPGYPKPYPIEPVPGDPDPYPIIGGEPMYEEPIRIIENQPVEFANPMPEFPGGDEALIKYIAKHIRYPESCLEKQMSGKIYIRFTVDENGKACDPHLLRGMNDCPEAEVEAKRLILKMPTWKPGEIEGKPVKVYMRIPINIHLD
jgi:hypothetical protein